MIYRSVSTCMPPTQFSVLRKPTHQYWRVKSLTNIKIRVVGTFKRNIERVR